MASKSSRKVASELDEKNRPLRLFLDSFTPPAVGIQDAPTRCYRINKEWSKILVGWLSLLTEIRGWAGATDESHAGIQAVMQVLIGEDCDMIDCLDVEDCLSTSPVIGALSLVSYSFQRNATQSHFDALVLAYDGTAQSIGSSIPVSAANTDSLTDNALCYALEQIIAVYATTKAAEISLKNNLQGFFQDVISAMRNIAPILPDWLFYLLGDDLFGCVVDFNAALSVLNDTTAKLDFACCLREELRTVSLTQAAFNAAIVTCVGSLTGAAGELACLFDGDNKLDHYLSFLEQYNTILVRQNDGDDFVCQCAPAGWFWLDVPWEWSDPTHSGSRQSPTFTHTNPANGELFSITAMARSDNPDDQRISPTTTGLSDTLVTDSPLAVRPNLRLWENAFVGVMEGADAVGWPSAQRHDINTDNSLEQPGASFTVRWGTAVDQGHSASIEVTRVRLLYKIVP